MAQYFSGPITSVLTSVAAETKTGADQLPPTGATRAVRATVIFTGSTVTLSSWSIQVSQDGTNYADGVTDSTAVSVASTVRTLLLEFPMKMVRFKMVTTGTPNLTATITWGFVDA